MCEPQSGILGAIRSSVPAVLAEYLIREVWSAHCRIEYLPKGLCAFYFHKAVLTYSV